MKSLSKSENFKRKPFQRILFTACALGLSVGSNLAVAQNGAGMENRFRDGWIEGKVETIYLLNPHLNNFEIDAEVHGDAMVLTGEVDEAIDKDLAEAIAEGIDGIKTVDNRITVADRRTKSDEKNEKPGLAQKVKDITTTTVIKGKFLNSPHISGFAIDVDTSNGMVTLNGDVNSEAAKDLAWRLAKNTDGVISVENNLKVVKVKKSASNS